MSIRSVVISLVAIALVLVVSWQWHKNQWETSVAISNDVVREHEAYLTEIVTALDNGTAVGAAKNVNDCVTADRYRFDELLSRLSTLNRSELVELDDLFGDCAFYFSTVQNVGVASFGEAVAVYDDHLRVAAQFNPAVENKLETVASWQELVTLETERSGLQTTLTNIQGDIVARLMQYETSASPAVQALVSEGQEVRQNLSFLDQQIDTLRTQIITHEAD